MSVAKEAKLKEWSCNPLFSASSDRQEQQLFSRKRRSEAPSNDSSFNAGYMGVSAVLNRSTSRNIDRSFDSHHALKNNDS